MELIKIADVEDVKKYIGLLYSELFGESAVPSDKNFTDIFNQLNNTEIYHQAYCLTENANTLAFFTLSESFSVFAHGRYGIINELWVNKECRSQGVGKAVINEIKKIAKGRGWKRVDVSAPPNKEWDRTFEFYQANGFTFTGRKLKFCLTE